MHALVLQAGQQSTHVLLTLRSNSENEKPPLFQQRKTFVKASIRPWLHSFLCLAGVPQEHVLTKSTGTSPALLAISQLSILYTAAPLLLPVHRWLAQGVVARLWEPSHAYWERSFQALCLCDWMHCQTPKNFQIHEGSNPVYLSFHLQVDPPVEFPSFQFRRTEAQQTANMKSLCLTVYTKSC